MTPGPMRLYVRWVVTWMMLREFGLSPARAEQFTTQLIEALHRRGFEIVRERDHNGRRGFRWEDLSPMADILEAERNGIKPWSPPELTTSGTSGKR